MTAPITLDDVLSELRETREELADLKAGIPYHTHTCPVDGVQWRCTSPYCERLQQPCSTHGGGPVGRPPTYSIDLSYERGKRA